MKKVYVVQPPSETRETFVKHHYRLVRGIPLMFFFFSVYLAAVGAFAQQSDRDRGQGNLDSLDPGPRAGFVIAGNPGNPIQGLSSQQLLFFQNGLSQFIEVEGVTLPSPGNGGLGPTFNGNSCGSCHSQPATGGSSPRGRLRVA